MSFLWRRFQKKNEDDYETVLADLANNIQKRQVKLSEIRQRERRTTLWVTLYTLAGWVGYVAVWYTGLLPHGKTTRLSQPQKALYAFPVVLGPIIVLFIRRVVQIWFERKGNAEEKTLQKLLKEQRAKVEEIKKKTNYYSTRDLLQKYDESSPSSSPLRNGSVSQASTPQRPRAPPPNGPGSASQPRPPTVAVPAPPAPLGPVRKQWYDKLADAVLGDDDVARYALICEQCFSHNGLVKESVWEETQYVCPKCKHFNPSQRSKKTGLVPKSPASASTAAPFSPRSPSSLTSPLLVSPQQPVRLPNQLPPVGDRHSPEHHVGESMEVDS